MTVRLVTLFGGGGFLGRYVAQALLETGVRLRVAQRDPRQAFRLRPLSRLGQTQFVAADIRKPDTVARAIDGADAVINLVGVLKGDMQGLHVDGARNVAEAAARAGVESVVQVSAIGADPESPSRYGRTKGEGEAAVRAAFPSATILRPSILFGREDDFINRFARMMMLSPVVPVLRPRVKFQPVYVDDVGRAAARALLEPGLFGGRVFELGGPDTLSMIELIAYIAREIGRSPALIELPDAIGAAIASAGFLPGAPITKDQWLMLQRDNVAAAGAEGLAAFGIHSTPLAAIAPDYLVVYRKHGRFARQQAA